MKHSKERPLIVYVALALLAVVSLAFVAFEAPAAEPSEPAITFGASVTSANGQLATRLTWSTTPAATSCTASGHQSWAGTKPAAGSADLPVIALSGTYTLRLDCTWPGDTTARLAWGPPTQNTDGSALPKCASQNSTGNCLRFFRLYHGSSETQVASPQAQSRAVNDRNATTYEWTALGAGLQCFAVTAINGDNVESDLSAVGCKTVTLTSQHDASITLTVNPKPAPPGGFGVQ